MTLRDTIAAIRDQLWPRSGTPASAEPDMNWQWATSELRELRADAERQLAVIQHLTKVNKEFQDELGALGLNLAFQDKAADEATAAMLRQRQEIGDLRASVAVRDQSIAALEATVASLQAELAKPLPAAVAPSKDARMWPAKPGVKRRGKAS